MFTKMAAILFVLEGGFKHANLVNVLNGQYQVWSDTDSNFTFRKPDGGFSPMDAEFKEHLGQRGDGWFVSALRDDEWQWHFSLEDSGASVRTFNFGSWLHKVIFRNSA